MQCARTVRSCPSPLSLTVPWRRNAPGVQGNQGFDGKVAFLQLLNGLWPHLSKQNVVMSLKVVSGRWWSRSGEWKSMWVRLLDKLSNWTTIRFCFCGKLFRMRFYPGNIGSEGMSCVLKYVHKRPANLSNPISPSPCAPSALCQIFYLPAVSPLPDKP